MLDAFAVFNRGGALLWTLQFTALRHNPLEALNALIRTCLLEERSGDNTYTYTPKVGAAQSLKWTFHNVRSYRRGLKATGQRSEACQIVSCRELDRRPTQLVPQVA
jgi:hypothetical protein